MLGAHKSKYHAQNILKHFGARAMAIYGMVIQNNTILSNAK